MDKDEREMRWAMRGMIAELVEKAKANGADVLGVLENEVDDETLRESAKIVARAFADELRRGLDGRAVSHIGYFLTEVALRLSGVKDEAGHE